MAKYVQLGNSIDFTNSGAAIKYGQVVPLKDCIGIAAADIPKNGAGALDLTGAFEMPAIGEIELGEKVFWDMENEVITVKHESPAAGDPEAEDPNENLIPAGVAITVKSGAAEGTVVVRLSP